MHIKEDPGGKTPRLSETGVSSTGIHEHRLHEPLLKPFLRMMTLVMQGSPLSTDSTYAQHMRILAWAYAELYCLIYHIV